MKLTVTTYDEMVRETLRNMAFGARERSHCPISNFKVGAAILSSRHFAATERLEQIKGHHFYVGTNFEDPAFNHTIHAEQAAIGAMIAEEGAAPLDAVVVVGGACDKDPILPCGHCRQLLVELTDDDTPIFSYSEDDTYRGMWTLGTLLPFAFRLSNFK